RDGSAGDPHSRRPRRRRPLRRHRAARSDRVPWGSPMTVEPSDTTAPRPEANGTDHQPNRQQGWLAGLRARLGLTGTPTLRDTLEAALKGEASGNSAFTAEEREMLLRILRFGALRVEDVMVPRPDIIAMDESETIAELLRLFEEAEVSRIPLYRDTLDDP